MDPRVELETKKLWYFIHNAGIHREHPNTVGTVESLPLKFKLRPQESLLDFVSGKTDTIACYNGKSICIHICLSILTDKYKYTKIHQVTFRRWKKREIANIHMKSLPTIMWNLKLYLFDLVNVIILFKFILKF